MEGAGMTTEVAMINCARAVAITEDGQELPVVASFDGDGDDCNLEDAVACTAGPDRDGKWLAIDLRQFEGVTVQ
jgi:hypothetical protein